MMNKKEREKMSNQNNQGGNNPKPVKTYDEPFGGQHITPQAPKPAPVPAPKPVKK